MRKKLRDRGGQGARVPQGYSVGGRCPAEALGGCREVERWGWLHVALHEGEVLG